MFTSPAHAEQVLTEAMGADYAALVLPLLRPCFCFAESDDATPGATRFGGMPDVPPGFTWPMRPTESIDIAWWTFPEHLAHFGLSAATDRQRRHIARGMPYVFLAQLDLTSTSGHVAGLPDQGRLLFFYDVTSGVGDQNPPTACKVIWDRSARHDLARAAPPPALIEAARDETMRHNGKQYEGLAALEASSDFYAPEQPMRLQPTHRTPHTLNTEWYQTQELKRLSEYGSDETKAAYDAYCELLEPLWGPDGNQLMGPPYPIQWDPREIDAMSLDDQPRPTSPWRLLLQLGTESVLQVPTNGMIYFLIMEDDLAAQDFSRVAALWQWT